MPLAGFRRHHCTEKVDPVVTAYEKQTKPNLWFKNWVQMMLNKHEILSVLQTRTRCGEKQLGAERGHLQAGLIFFPKGENWSSATQLATALSSWGNTPISKGKTGHLKVEENVKSVFWKICVCSDIKPPKSRGNECPTATQLIELLGRVMAFLGAQPWRAPDWSKVTLTATVINLALPVNAKGRTGWPLAS